MHAPVLPVFSWDAIRASQAELGLRHHLLPGRARLAVARLKRSPLWPALPFLALALLWLDARLSSLSKGATP